MRQQLQYESLQIPAQQQLVVKLTSNKQILDTENNNINICFFVLTKLSSYPTLYIHSLSIPQFGLIYSVMPLHVVGLKDSDRQIDSMIGVVLLLLCVCIVKDSVQLFGWLVSFNVIYRQTPEVNMSICLLSHFQ